MGDALSIKGTLGEAELPSLFENSWTLRSISFGYPVAALFSWSCKYLLLTLSLDGSDLQVFYVGACEEL